jgi:putative ABC transport system ATP-binding protein
VEGVLTILRELARPGRIVLVSTHDDRVTRLADRVVELAPRGATAMATEPSEIVLAAGDPLFAQGDYGDLVYVVEEGRVELFHVREDGSHEPVSVVEPGQYFGELAPLLSMPRSCSAAALTPARVTAYPINVFSRRFPRIHEHMRATATTP